ncbi:hypothetical protein QAD02_008933 [Eretmocerus hayati]|uniref:Uncharacterized protein n=1 Tax=Eretmocerus hayati TaxID=131215 RepID=A0ACC2N9B4_9HYME|nr:hypothetical protein QAD02_008933 [Eretmocerus hayati]
MLLALMMITGHYGTRAAPADYSLMDDKDWAIFKHRYKKSYDSTVEENYRRSVFHENQQKIDTHNKQYDLGVFSYKIKMNQFGDMLPDEYKNYMHADNDTLLMPKRIVRGEEFIPPKNVTRIPDFMDWRQRGAVTPVQDQGLKCGACWAFSAASALEGQYYRKSGQLLVLSAQNLLDCTIAYGNMGCRGGSAALAFQFAADRKGIETEAYYTYEGRTKPCPYNVSDDFDLNFDVDDDDKNHPLASFIYVTKEDEMALKVAIATVGPLSAAMDGSHDTFRFYSEGIYYQPECNKDGLDHAVLIVGYGTDSNNRDYWLVKNSWGESWGENGYFKIARNRQNHCGIATAAIYPVIR